VLKIEEIDESKYPSLPVEECKMRWWWLWTGQVSEIWRCFFTNLGLSEISDFQDLHTHWNCKRDLTGSLQRISSTRSNERVDMGGWRVTVTFLMAASSWWRWLFRLSEKMRRRLVAIWSCFFLNAWNR
jgi:hypothetical protein